MAWVNSALFWFFWRLNDCVPFCFRTQLFSHSFNLSLGSPIQISHGTPYWEFASDLRKGVTRVGVTRVRRSHGDTPTQTQNTAWTYLTFSCTYNGNRLVYLIYKQQTIWCHPCDAVIGVTRCDRGHARGDATGPADSTTGKVWNNKIWNYCILFIRMIDADC